jgi:hypothetical protein
MENRFKKAVESNTKFHDAGESFFKASIKLAKEIALKGSKGEKLTDSEFEFMKSSTVFLMQGMVVSSESGGANSVN